MQTAEDTVAGGSSNITPLKARVSLAFYKGISGFVKAGEFHIRHILQTAGVPSSASLPVTPSLSSLKYTS